MSSENNTKPTSAEWGKPLEAMSQAFQSMIALRRAGATWEAVKAETGVGYASGWLAEQREAFRASTPDGFLADGVAPKMSAAQFNAWVTERRLVHGESWGTIMALCGVPEGRVRSGFEQKTNVFSEGLRNGKGGRFLQDNAEAYAPAPKVGWVRPTEAGVVLPEEIKAGLVKAGVLPADITELEGMTQKALRAFAKSLDLKATGSKVTLIERIAEALA